MSSSCFAVSLTWLKTADDFLQLFTVCRLPADYSDESFWIPEKGNTSSFVDVVHSSQELRVVCDTSLVPSNIYSKSEGNLVGFSLPTPSTTVLPALLEKFLLCGVPIPVVVSALDSISYVFLKSGDAALLQCAVQELWDAQFRFSFLDSSNQLQRTALESRQLTMLASVYRHYKPISTVPKSFTIHCLGAESKEYTDFASMLSGYNLLFNSLHHLGVSDLKLVFIGPNLYPSGEDSPTSYRFEDKLNIHFSICCNLYHNFVDQQLAHEHNTVIPVSSLSSDSPPISLRCMELVDLVILFQAGLWGYDSWHPTLKMFGVLPITQIVITSYSLLEGENDFDTLEEHCCYKEGEGESEGTRWCVWNFEDEKNPYACTEPIPRTSAPDCNIYYDNCAWQSVSFVSHAAATAVN